MARVEYYHDVAAPQALELCPAAFAIVRNGLGQVLLVRCYPSPLAGSLPASPRPPNRRDLRAGYPALAA